MFERLRHAFRNQSSGATSTGQPTDSWKISVYPFIQTLQHVDAQDLRDLTLFLEGLGKLLASDCRPTSQLGQEAFALGFNPPGSQVFVECGAAGPEFLSNTFQLQHSFAWQGLLVEPNPAFVAELSQRASDVVHVIPCAAGSHGFINLVCAQELSTAIEFINVDDHAPERRAASLRGDVQVVQKRPLSDIFEASFANEESIGFLSIDVEGSEQDVLESLEWSRWRPRTVAVEHNNRQPLETEIDFFMVDKGYRRVLPSFTDWDAWYVPDEQAER